MARYSKHDKTVDELAARLQDKNRYFAVATEVPIFATDKLTYLRGQADVMTIDTQNHRVTYWEVKTGFHPAGYLKAKKQAQRFYAKMSSDPAFQHWQANFVYYNPNARKVLRIKRIEI